MIYGSDCRSGALMGVRLEDGERLWQTFKPTTGDRRASHGTAFIIRHEDRYFLNSETGDLILSKLSPQGYEELGRFHMLKPDSEAFGRKVVWSHPAFANRCVFARNNSELICVNLAEQGAARQIRQQRKVTLSQATTRISEPVLPDGFPDYVEHLNRRQSAGVTPENNAVVLFWQVVGTKEVNEIPASWREEYFRRLGVPMPPLEGDYLQDAAEYAKSHGAADAVESGQFNTLLDDLYRRPWTEKESPLLVKWLAASEQPLKLAIAMSRRPRHYEPLVCLDPSFRLVGVAIPSTQGSRRVARALTLRAMLRLGQNNVAGAWEDIAAVRRLSRLVNEGPFMVEGLVAIAISGLGVDGEAAIAHYGRLTPAQAAEYRRELEASAPLTGLARRMDEGERLCFLDSMCAVSKHGPF
jgi:hypothetical protein